jgi:hypothetical protein
VFVALSRQVRDLWWVGERFLFGFALAVDGRSAGFLSSTGSLAADETVEEIHVIDNETREARKLADCPNSRLIKHGTTSFIYKSRCYRLVAGLDGQTWLWSDIEGVWQGALDQPARFLLAHDYFDNDPPRTYDPTDDWSPDGRYQLLLSRRGEGTNRWVLDMDSGQTIELPLYANSFNRYGQWQWTPDNHLLALREPLFEGEEDNFAE